VEKWQPDLVLLDIMMPRLSGFEVCKRLKANARTRDIAVLMITALDQPSDIERAVEAGTDEFMSKPIKRTDLLHRVRSLLRPRQRRGEVAPPGAYCEAGERRENGWPPGPGSASEGGPCSRPPARGAARGRPAPPRPAVLRPAPVGLRRGRRRRRGRAGRRRLR